tara:strand:+ start:952 stop:1332 length:381 start_codon:yes stop_codon:yes gene_type:complete
MNNYNFLFNFENIYQNLSIYRSIIIVKNTTDANYIYELLINKNHSILVIDDINIFINNLLYFNNFNERVIIIRYDLLYNLINYLNNNNMLDCIDLIVYYKFNYLLKDILTSYYYKISNYSHNTIII